jgi:iron complex transport system substrate-binding protein
VSRVTAANAAALAGALALSLGGGLDRRPRDDRTIPGADLIITSSRRVRLPGGGEGIPDASGRIIPLRPYRRIVSTSTVTDGLLLELAEPDRVLAVSQASVASSPWRWKFAGKTGIDGLGPLEPIIALKPDLVLINYFGAESRAEKLRAAGIEAFNLGELHGLRTFLPMAEIVGDLLGDPGRGQRFARAFRARFDRVAVTLGSRPRRRALYLSVIGNIILGGTRGTSYHDVLVHAGLEDAAAATFKDWIQYTAEQLVALDPELLVSKDESARSICTYPGLDRLQACRIKGRILTLPEALIDEPGLGMLEAAERLFAKAYPDLAASP